MIGLGVSGIGLYVLFPERKRCILSGETMFSLRENIVFSEEKQRKITGHTESDGGFLYISVFI